MRLRVIAAAVFGSMRLGPLFGALRPEAPFWRRAPLVHRALRKLARGALLWNERPARRAIAKADRLANVEGRTEAAEAVLTAALRARPASGPLLLALFEHRRADDRAAAALELCGDGRADRPASPEAALALAWIALNGLASARAGSSVGRPDATADSEARALAVLRATERLLESDATRRERAVGMILRGVAAAELGLDDAALAALAAASEAKPDMFWAPYLAGCLHAARRRTADARAAFARTLALRPDFLDARWALVRHTSDARAAADLAAGCFDGARHYRLRHIESDFELCARDFEPAPPVRDHRLGSPSESNVARAKS